MRADKYSAYCAEHVEEFRDELREDASRALRTWPGRTAVLLLLASSLLTWLNLDASGNPHAVRALFSYAPAIALILLFPVLTLVFAKLDKYAAIILDVFLLSILLGFCLSVHYALQPVADERTASGVLLALSGQLNFVILMTTAFAYHSRFGITLRRNTLYALIAATLIYTISPAYLSVNAIQVAQGYLGGIIVSWLFYRRIQIRFYYKSIDADTRQHLYMQLSKLVYPHQLSRIKAGDQLESTMPVEKGRAIINVFDIQNSSAIRHEHTQDFFLEVFGALSQICMIGYEHNPLRSRAFRLKETGDGFISAVGYPFLTEDVDSLADHALETALMMFRAFNIATHQFGYPYPIKAAMGLACNDVQGTFQSSGIRAYDLFGDALVQADRYEELRKNPVIAGIIREHASELDLSHYNILIIQATIHQALSQPYQRLFREVDLAAVNVSIPQDPDATHVYFHLLE